MTLRDLQYLGLVVFLAVISAGVQYAMKGNTYLQGDSFYYAYTAESLIGDFDFDLTNRLAPSGVRDELRKHEGFFAASPDGKVVPKHSTLMPLMTLPFLLLFGTIGFLIFNVVTVSLLVFFLAKLGGGTFAARITAIVVFVTGSWLTYSFNYSPDPFATLLIVGAFVAAQYQRWMLSGVPCGLAVWAKVYAALIVLPLAIVIVPAGPRAILKAILGALPGLLAMMIIHQALYGGPFVTGYDRDARVAADRFTLTEHYSRFHQPFIDGLWRLVTDRNAGLIRTSPLCILWPLGFYYAIRMRNPYSRPMTMALALGAMINVLFFAKYDEWNASTNGNRFLFPAVALGGALIVPLIQQLSIFTRRDREGANDSTLPHGRVS